MCLCTQILQNITHTHTHPHTHTHTHTHVHNNTFVVTLRQINYNQHIKFTCQAADFQNSVHVWKCWTSFFLIIWYLMSERSHELISLLHTFLDSGCNMIGSLWIRNQDWKRRRRVFKSELSECGGDLTFTPAVRPHLHLTATRQWTFTYLHKMRVKSTLFRFKAAGNY